MAFKIMRCGVISGAKIPQSTYLSRNTSLPFYSYSQLLLIDMAPMPVLLQELLALLGQPYVVSPGEAEAQCAWLEQHGLSHGVVTDDSDAWLFGAQCVYRHLFRPDRRPTRFQMRDLSSQFGVCSSHCACFYS